MTKYTAIIIESEAGWGQRIDEVKEFDTADQRDAFIREFNSHNNLPTVPSWYMYAEMGNNREVA